MLTGHRIYAGASPSELITMHVSSPIPKLPSSLSHYQPTLDRLLAKNPEDRFQSASELCGDITL
jgi:serine/threonine protein kinase